MGYALTRKCARRQEGKPPRIAPAAAILLILLLPVASGSWNQSGGNAHRSGVVHLPDYPLDVVSTFSLSDEGFVPNGAGHFVDTPHGPAGILQTPPAGMTALPAGECRLIRIADARTGLVEVVESFPCENGGKLFAYDEQRSLLILSVEEPTPEALLQMREWPTGEVVWSTGPPEELPSGPAAADTFDWAIDSVAISSTSDRMFVAFTKEAERNYIQAIDLHTRRPDWTRTIPVWRQALDVEEVPLGPLEAATGVSNGLHVTVTDTGLVFMQHGANPSSSEDDRALGTTIWMDLEGNLVGSWHQPTSRTTTQAAAGEPPRDLYTYSLEAAGQGHRAVALVGSDILFIDPERPGIDVVPVDARAGSGVPAARPTWIADKAVVPARTGIHVHDVTSGQTTWWPGHEGARVNVVLGAASGNEAWVALSPDTGSATGTLARLELTSAKTLQMVPLPTLGTDLRLMPVEEPPGVLVWDQFTSNAAFLGQADPDLMPAVALDVPYPAVNQPVQIDVQSPGAQKVVLAWGDGAIAQESGNATLTRAYGAAGLHTIRVTAIYEDGRTATREISVFVGSDPPAENFLQKAFARDNQDLTFGVIGIALVILGALAGLLARRRGRFRIAAGLRELGRIREQGADEPMAALRELQDWHRIQERRLLQGRLTEDQFRVLESHAARLLRRTGQRILRPLSRDLSPTLHHHLEAVMVDGFVDAAEVADLRLALSREGMPAAKRKMVESLLAAWE